MADTGEICHQIIANKHNRLSQGPLMNSLLHITQQKMKQQTVNRKFDINIVIKSEFMQEVDLLL